MDLPRAVNLPTTLLLRVLLFHSSEGFVGSVTVVSNAGASPDNSEGIVGSVVGDSTTGNSLDTSESIVGSVAVDSDAGVSPSNSEGIGGAVADDGKRSQDDTGLPGERLCPARSLTKQPTQFSC
jgi:hypothetical protein